MTFVSMLTKPPTNHTHKWKATLDGVDISNDCVEADDEPGAGYVILFALDADRHVIEANPSDPDSDLAHELRRGVVVLTKGERLRGR